MHRQTGRRWLAVLVMAGVAGSGVLAGCSNDRPQSSTPLAGPGDKRAAPDAGKPPARDAQQGAAAPAQYRRDDRSLVFTGEITVRVAKVEPAAAAAVDAAEAAGGFVAGDKRSSDADSSAAHITLRVPADRFFSTVDALARLGTEEIRSMSTDDVTAEVVDLDAQILSQKASVERTRALLAKAQTIGEIVSIEAELAKRESALATLEARKRRLADLTALSTITAHLLGPDADSPQGRPDEPTFLSGLKAGWDAFLGAVRVLLVILGFLLPFAVVLAIPTVLAWWLVRRRRPRREAAEPPPAQPAGSPGR
jgi:hypothetical protein